MDIEEKEQSTSAVPLHAPDVLAPGDLSPGDYAGNYRISARLSSGGFGTVYVAEHRTLKRKAAVKVMHADCAQSKEMVGRFLREAQAVVQLSHPNIVQVFDFGELENGRPYYVMELLEGESLREYVQRSGALSCGEVLEILEPLANALNAAHEAGIIHRDVKASNVMVVRKQDQMVVKLLDFGVAKLLDPGPGEAGLTTAGRRIGTPYAMAPEQITCMPVDRRTDVYALGVLLFHALTGRPPFLPTERLEMDRLHLLAPPPKPSQFASVTKELDAVVLRCLEKRKEGRYDSALEVLQAFRAAVGAQGDVPAKATRCVGVFVEVRLDLGNGEPGEDEDSLMDSMELALDTAKQLLEGAGYILSMDAACSVLGVAPLPEQETDQARHRMVTAAADIYEQLAKAVNDANRICVTMTTHIDDVLMREGTPIGGPLLRLGNWAITEAPGAYATARAVAGLDEPRLITLEQRAG
jgi:serine/threonine-protein kinase